MSSDPFIFKRQNFSAMTRLKCYRDTGDVYAFVVNTRMKATRSYKNRLYTSEVRGTTPLTQFDMINIGYGMSLIRFVGPDNLLLRHTGPAAQVTLVVHSKKSDASISQDSVDVAADDASSVDDVLNDAGDDSADVQDDARDDTESSPDKDVDVTSL